jgi:hypothetical protein
MTTLIVVAILSAMVGGTLGALAISMLVIARDADGDG